MKKMTNAAKKSRAEYFREYRRLHPEKVTRWTLAYWEKRAKREAEARSAAEARGEAQG